MRAAWHLAQAADLGSQARWVDGEANWAPGPYPPRPGTARFLMPWCHGAPGFVTALAGVYPSDLDARVDTLLLQSSCTTCAR